MHAGLEEYVERFHDEAIHLDMLLTMDFKHLDALGACCMRCCMRCCMGFAGAEGVPCEFLCCLLEGGTQCAVHAFIRNTI